MKPVVDGVGRPHTRVAVGLQLDPDRAALRALAVAARAIQDAGQILDVVAVLVGEDVGLGERPASGAELRLQLGEEAEIDVHARDRSGSRTGRPRRRPGRSRSAPGPRRTRSSAGVYRDAELRGPVRLDAVDVGDDPAFLLVIGVGSRAARLGQLASRTASERLVIEPADVAQTASAREWIDAQQQRDHHHDQADAAPADRHRAAAQPTSPTAARSSAVVDLGGVEAGVFAKLHPSCLGLALASWSPGVFSASAASLALSVRLSLLPTMSLSSLASPSRESIPPRSSTIFLA